MTGVKSIQWTTPREGQGAMYVNPNVATAAGDEFPTTGRGASSTTEANAVWADMTAGTFEVIIVSVHLEAGTTLLTINELHGDANTLVLEGHGTIPAPYDKINIPMRDGFSFNSDGDGCLITFRIQRYIHSEA